MSKLVRPLMLVAMLAAMNLAAIPAIAHATGPPTRQQTSRPATDPQAEKAWPQRRAVAAQAPSTPDATLRRVLARERFTTPTGTPAQATSPLRPAQRSRQAPWPIPILGVLAVLTLATTAAVLAARRAGRPGRAGQPA
jgi:hypothetical protein